MFKKIVIVLVGVVLLWLLASFIRLSILTKRGVQSSITTTPFSRQGNDGKKILILGDSLAYGTGTSSPEKSVAGLVASRFPDATVENKAVNGKQTKGLASEMDDIKGQYDLILVIIGGNDVLRPWISLNESGKNLDLIYAKAAEHSDNVIALTTGDLRYTTFFLWPANHYFSRRSVILRDKAVTAANKTKNVTYINLVERNKYITFDHLKEAPDRLHLSDDGARYWFDAIKDTNKL